MNTGRKTAILAGALYFSGIIAGVFSMVPVIDIPNYLAQISANTSQVNSGAFFQFLMTAAHVGMAITLYPILKKQNESLALGYVGSRLVAAAFNIIGVIILLLLLTLSQEFVKAGAPVSIHFQTIGELLRTGRDLVNHAGVVMVMCVGELTLYYLLHQTKLVPRWLAGWGIVGAVVAIVAGCLFMFRSIDLMTSVYMDFPLALQEMVFAVWLISKGFNPSVVVSGTAK
ncbi:MAG: DUF4386 domain-containing protein [Chloroflexi bacterium]|nr:DUF4386 domain-containing protein [Chloroflexota bacterium]